MEAAMLDTATPMSGALPAPFPDGIDTESLRGHFFQLYLYLLPVDGELVGGALQYGQDRIALDPDHACQLAGRVRAAIDNAVAGGVIHRPRGCSGGH
jgi:hypothetical protein